MEEHPRTPTGALMCQQPSSHWLQELPKSQVYWAVLVALLAAVLTVGMLQQSAAVLRRVQQRGNGSAMGWGPCQGL